MRAMADHLMQYWDDLAIEKNGSEDTNRFWKSFGYLSARWRDPPSDDEKYARKRNSCVSLCVQCGELASSITLLLCKFRCSHICDWRKGLFLIFLLTLLL